MYLINLLFFLALVVVALLTVAFWYFVGRFVRRGCFWAAPHVLNVLRLVPVPRVLRTLRLVHQETGLRGVVLTLYYRSRRSARRARSGRRVVGPSTLAGTFWRCPRCGSVCSFGSFCINLYCEQCGVMREVVR